MDDWVQPAVAQITAQQRRSGRTIDIIVAENGNLFGADHGVSDTGCRLRIPVNV